MEIKYSKSQINNPLEILRKAGYTPFRDPKTKEESFIIRLTTGFYPRFHLYLNDHGHEIGFSLHLDQKQPSYEGTSAHGGEYDGPVVEKEMLRIKGWIHSVENIPIDSSDIERNQTKHHPEETSNANPEPDIQPFGGIFG